MQSASLDVDISLFGEGFLMGVGRRSGQLLGLKNLLHMLRPILLGYGCEPFPAALERLPESPHPFLLSFLLHLPII